jgi:hypothetical protein
MSVEQSSSSLRSTSRASGKLARTDDRQQAALPARAGRKLQRRNPATGEGRGTIEIEQRLSTPGVGFTLNWDAFADVAIFLAQLGAAVQPREAQRIKQRERRQEEARQRAVIKRALKAGLPVTGATVDGVDLKLGATDAAKEATLTPLQAWRAKHARQA